MLQNVLHSYKLRQWADIFSNCFVHLMQRTSMNTVLKDLGRSNPTIFHFRASLYKTRADLKLFVVSYPLPYPKQVHHYKWFPELFTELNQGSQQFCISVNMTKLWTKYCCSIKKLKIFAEFSQSLLIFPEISLSFPSFPQFFNFSIFSSDFPGFPRVLWTLRMDQIHSILTHPLPTTKTKKFWVSLYHPKISIYLPRNP